MNDCRLTEQVLDAVSRYHMLDGVSTLLTALSGGSDSTALLLALNDICRCRGIKLFAAHVNHLIRGDEAYRDQRFCAELCRKLGIPLFIGIFDVPAAAAAWKLSVETAARDIRYSYFDSLMDLWGIDACATAHNANDRAETVIFNLARGASLNGAAGIPPVRGRYIRPLIGCPKKDIISYVSRSGYGWVEDSTNSDTAYTRNYIRSEIVPRLGNIDSDAVSAICRFADSALRDSSFIDSIAGGYSPDTPVRILAELDDAVLYRWLAKRFGEAGCGETGAGHISSAAGLIRQGKKGSMLSLPGRVRMTVGDSVAFGIDPRGEKTFAGYQVRLSSMPADIPGTGIMIAVRRPDEPALPCDSSSGKNIYSLSIQIPLAFDTIKGELFAAARMPGDTVMYLGVNRNLAKLMNELGMPTKKRDVTPVIRDDIGVVCVPELISKGNAVCRDGVFTKEADGSRGSVSVYVADIMQQK
ncbi:MAG: tRNA lysidine(34) synthetase TilS [Clostridiales bacterium]|nr:tRNA lysidine(34) synthetase TilS [Clostridiales bacterium]